MHDPKMEETGTFFVRVNEDLRTQNELLKTQLMGTSLINELTRVMQSCTDLESIIKTVLLGIQDIAGFNRAVLFEIDKENFCLKPRSWVGFSDTPVQETIIPLGFEGGEITDAIFLNRHLIVEEVDKQSDILFTSLASPAYCAVPLVGKVTRKCFEVKQCGKTACPAYNGFNPYCWSVPGGQQCAGNVSEDDKRKACIACKCFRAEGVFWMDRAHSMTPVSSDDITLLTSIINQASLIIENVKVLSALEVANTSLTTTNEKLTIVNHDLSVAQGKIQSDLDHARMIQLGLLPDKLGDIRGFTVGSIYIPATAVGGDYFDVFPIDKESYGIVIADVSGHGIASALIMSMVKVLLKMVAPIEPSPQKALERINTIFLKEIRTDNFVTIFYAVYNTVTHQIRFTSAGHCPVLFVNKITNTSSQIKADGLFLGAFDDMMLCEQSRQVDPECDRLVLYTDGLIEAQNGHEEMFELKRLEDASIKTSVATPQKAIDEIIRVQKVFCGSMSEMEDDITMLVIDF